MTKTPEDYEPFGDEWKKEINKIPKALIIDMLANKGKEVDSLRSSNAVEQSVSDEEVEGILKNVCIDYTHRWSQNIQASHHKQMSDYVLELRSLLSPTIKQKEEENG